MTRKGSRRIRRIWRAVGLGIVALIVATSMAGPLGAIMGIAIAMPFLLAAFKETDQTPPVASAAPKRGPGLLQLAEPAGACVLCMGTASPLFATRRVVLCEKCVWIVREEGSADPNELQRQLEIIIQTVLRGHEIVDIEPLLKLALDSGSMCVDVDKYMRLATFDGWRVVLRAYHLGLLSYPDAATRPDERTWQALAHEIRVEDGMRCNVCGSKNEAMHVHHIIPLGEGGTNSRRNLVTLCHGCHLAQHPCGNFSQPDRMTAAI